MGDTVYLEDTPYIVEEIGLFDVQLRDPTLAYPVLRAESKERMERMLEAIQAQEDETQEKLKEKAGVVVRGKKNW